MYLNNITKRTTELIYGTHFLGGGEREFQTNTTSGGGIDYLPLPEVDDRNMGESYALIGMS